MDARHPREPPIRLRKSPVDNNPSGPVDALHRATGIIIHMDIAGIVETTGTLASAGAAAYAAWQARNSASSAKESSECANEIADSMLSLESERLRAELFPEVKLLCISSKDRNSPIKLIIELCGPSALGMVGSFSISVINNSPQRQLKINSDGEISASTLHEFEGTNGRASCNCIWAPYSFFGPDQRTECIGEMVVGQTVEKDLQLTGPSGRCMVGREPMATEKWISTVGGNLSLLFKMTRQVKFGTLAWDFVRSFGVHGSTLDGQYVLLDDYEKRI